MTEKLSFLNDTVGIETIFSGGCNMRCQYCYIHKDTATMKQYNDAIRKSIKEGLFQQRIKDTFKDYKENIINLSLWGGEPTVNADVFDIFMEPLLDFFPNASEIMYSTNGKLTFEKGNKLIMECLKKYSKNNNRQIKLLIQFSIDGPEWLTDYSRNEMEITQKILKNLEDTIAYSIENCDDLFSVQYCIKPTLASNWWEYILDNNLLMDWFLFFNNLQKKYKKQVGNNPSIILELVPEPTLVIPERFTKKDGILYKRWIQEIKKLDLTILDEYRAPLITKYYSAWAGSLGDLEFSNSKLKCSAGLTSCSISYLGELMACHRTYDNHAMGKNKIGKIQNELVDINNNDHKTEYVLGAYHANHKFKESVLKAEVAALVSSGEIDKKYLDPVMLKVLYTFIGPLLCFSGESTELTGDMFLIEFGYIRLLCNGALEEIIDYYDKSFRRNEL